MLETKHHSGHAHEDWHNQRYQVCNRMIKQRGGNDVRMDVHDHKRPKKVMAKHVQRWSSFGEIYTKLYIDAENYDQAVHRTHGNLEIKQELRQISGLKSFFNSKALLHVHGRL